MHFPVIIKAALSGGFWPTIIIALIVLIALLILLIVKNSKANKEKRNLLESIDTSVTQIKDDVEQSAPASKKAGSFDAERRRQRPRKTSGVKVVSIDDRVIGSGSGAPYAGLVGKAESNVSFSELFKGFDQNELKDVVVKDRPAEHIQEYAEPFERSVSDRYGLETEDYPYERLPQQMDRRGRTQAPAQTKSRPARAQAQTAPRVQERAATAQRPQTDRYGNAPQRQASRAAATIEEKRARAARPLAQNPGMTITPAGEKKRRVSVMDSIRSADGTSPIQPLFQKESISFDTINDFENEAASQDKPSFLKNLELPTRREARSGIETLFSSGTEQAEDSGESYQTKQWLSDMQGRAGSGDSFDEPKARGSAVKYTDRNCGTDKNGAVHTEEELREQIKL